MEYLSQKGVPFTEKNVGRDPQARQELLALGLTSLPVLVIGDQRVSGFNPARIDAALAAAGLP
jgi:glutaredoxin 3